MKKLTAILLASLIIIVPMSNVVIYLAFKINQSVIAEVLCINKNQPSLHCDGKCYLKEKLAESNDKKNQSSPFKHMEDTMRITFFHHPLESLFLRSREEKCRHCFEYAGLSSTIYLNPFLHPPESQRFTV